MDNDPDTAKFSFICVGNDLRVVPYGKNSAHINGNLSHYLPEVCRIVGKKYVKYLLTTKALCANICR